MSELPRSSTPNERFWRRVSKTDGCWLWTGARSSTGYGNFWDGERNVGAHRFAYDQRNGRIQEGVVLGHLCSNLTCVNPAHLQPKRPGIERGRKIGPRPALTTLEERFWAKVEKTDGCWLWMAAKTHGYGNFKYGDRFRGAHRVSYEWLVGPIPDGLTLDHLCRNTACVNPTHLEPVTHAVNILRGDGPSAMHARKTHCDRGHPFDEQNTNKDKYGRRCRACHRDDERVRRQTLRVVA